MTPAPLAALLNTFDPPSGGSSACPDRADWRARKKGRPYRSRLARSGERKAWNVLRALPVGTSRAASQKAWLEAVEQSPALAHLRADALANVRKVAQQLAWRADWTTMTSRHPWPALAAGAGVSLRTVCRVVRRLRDAGLLGVVASGRSPAVQTVKAHAGQGEAAVYVLAVPSPLSVVEPADGPVDESGAASAPGSSVSEPLRARETANRSSEPAAPADRWPPGGGAAPAGRAVAIFRPPGALTRQMRLERRRAQARQVAWRVPVLRSISDRAVAAVLRDFALAQWTVEDLVHAIDWRPDGSRWPHDGATGVAQPAKWLTHRLAPWRDQAGEPLPSRSAAALDAARTRLAAQLRARAEAALDDARPWSHYSAGFAEFKAARAALPRRTPR